MNELLRSLLKDEARDLSSYGKEVLLVVLVASNGDYLKLPVPRELIDQNDIAALSMVANEWAIASESWPR